MSVYTLLRYIDGELEKVPSLVLDEATAKPWLSPEFRWNRESVHGLAWAVVRLLPHRVASAEAIVNAEKPSEEFRTYLLCARSVGDHRRATVELRERVTIELQAECAGSIEYPHLHSQPGEAIRPSPLIIPAPVNKPMKIDEVAQSGYYDPNARYLHGGPQELENQKLKRYGKNHGDAGALFFCKDIPVGRWYAGSYGDRIWICRLTTPVDLIFDFTNPKHRLVLQRAIDPRQYQSIASQARSGHLDWTDVDDELFGELGFRGVVFLERPAGMQTGMPASTGMAVLPEDVLSVGLFHAEDATIIGSATRDELWSTLTDAIQGPRLHDTKTQLR